MVWGNRAVTGADIACALRRAGCDVRLAPPEHVSLFRDGVEMARLPLCATLRAATLRVLLRTIGVTAQELAGYVSGDIERTDP